MDAYPLVVFFHIVGALGFFIALAAEWISTRALRRANTGEPVHEWLQLSLGARGFGMASMLLILATGFTLMVIAQLREAWLFVSLGTFVLVVVLAVALTMRRMGAIKRMLAEDGGSLSPRIAQAVHHPVLWLSIQIRLALTLGIVFLMTVKPALGPALLVMGIAALIGMVVGMPQASASSVRKDAAR